MWDNHVCPFCVFRVHKMNLANGLACFGLDTFIHRAYTKCTITNSTLSIVSGGKKVKSQRKEQ